jgi:hypothetical protein
MLGMRQDGNGESSNEVQDSGRDGETSVGLAQRDYERDQHNLHYHIQGRDNLGVVSITTRESRQGF